MKQLPINSTTKHPETQVKLGMSNESNAGEFPSTNESSRWEVGHPTSDIRSLEDLSDMDQVEYSERPYLSDEKWFG